MRVLFINRPKNLWTGGDYIKLEKIAEELVKLGIEVDISETPLISPAVLMRQYDIIHTWNFSMLWSKFAVWAGVKWGKKMVASMIYHNTEAHIPYELQQTMMNHMDACIYETESEIKRVETHLIPKNTYVVPNGVDSWWFEQDDSKVPFEHYILTVGRIEPTKGQYEVAQACKELGIRYIMIGESVSEDYTTLCLSEGAMLYPAMNQDTLKKWYKNCSVYVQASSNETWGMAVDEAGTQGVPIVISTGFERQNIPDVILCKHGNKESIKEAIQKGLSQRENLSFKAELQLRTWKNCAEDYQKIYNEILNK